MMRQEHLPYIGEHYDQGISGKRVAVVGFSHYVSDETEDSSDFTRECVRKLLQGEWETDPIFFRLVAKAFGYADVRDFFRRIMFFNWAPYSVGSRSEKFNSINSIDETRAGGRFRELIELNAPDVVLMFTAKPKLKAFRLAFRAMPEPLEHFAAARLNATRIFRLRHTQGATATELRAAVAFALDQTLGSGNILSR